MAFTFCCTVKIHALKLDKMNIPSKNKSLNNIKNLVKTIALPSISSSPLESLQNGNWVKLICGASFEDVVDIRNLSLVYTLAGVDCIDCAADASVISAVDEGILAAGDIINLRRPWVMISVNDDEDLHFRKAAFDEDECPEDCPRPCERICPANAISFGNKASLVSSHLANVPRAEKNGVLTERCYGCGRCFPVCPYDKIREVTYLRDAAATADLIRTYHVDALEIHTNGRQSSLFKEFWSSLQDSICHLRLLAVSLPDRGDSIVSTMNDMFAIMKSKLKCVNLLWQLDGRPMSGDIGRGATRQSIAFAVRMVAANDRPPGFLQLAGGTNAHTVDGLKKEGLFQTKSYMGNSLQASIGGIAYGGYARKIVGRVLRSMQLQHGLSARIEDYPYHLYEALKEALTLVGTVKHFHHCQSHDYKQNLYRL